MKNADMPAMPVNTNGEQWNGMADFDGLTKREMFAMHAMQGLMASTEHYGFACPQETAKSAVAHADALLKELEK